MTREITMMTQAPSWSGRRACIVGLAFVIAACNPRDPAEETRAAVSSPKDGGAPSKTEVRSQPETSPSDPRDEDPAPPVTGPAATNQVVHVPIRPYADLMGENQDGPVIAASLPARPIPERKTARPHTAANLLQRLRADRRDLKHLRVYDGRTGDLVTELRGVDRKLVVDNMLRGARRGSWISHAGAREAGRRTFARAIVTFELRSGEVFIGHLGEGNLSTWIHPRDPYAVEIDASQARARRRWDVDTGESLLDALARAMRPTPSVMAAPPPLASPHTVAHLVSIVRRNPRALTGIRLIDPIKGEVRATLGERAIQGARDNFAIGALSLGGTLSCLDFPVVFAFDVAGAGTFIGHSCKGMSAMQFFPVDVYDIRAAPRDIPIEIDIFVTAMDALSEECGTTFGIMPPRREVWVRSQVDLSLYLGRNPATHPRLPPPRYPSEDTKDVELGVADFPDAVTPHVKERIVAALARDPKALRSITLVDSKTAAPLASLNPALVREAAYGVGLGTNFGRRMRLDRYPFFLVFDVSGEGTFIARSSHGSTAVQFEPHQEVAITPMFSAMFWNEFGHLKLDLPDD